METTLGQTRWVLPGSWISATSSGPEPEATSRDELWLLNPNSTESRVEVTIYYEDRDPAGSYCLTVISSRLRVVRVNDLIDPEAVPLETNYAAILRATQPIVAQLVRIDSSGFPIYRHWSPLYPF